MHVFLSIEGTLSVGNLLEERKRKERFLSLDKKSIR